VGHAGQGRRRRLVRRALVAPDVTGLTIAYVLAKVMYGQHRQPTADDVVRVFALVTIGTWLPLAGSYLTALVGRRDP
jgi:hypothetical protein